jgi:hypothetical protein
VLVQARIAAGSNIIHSSYNEPVASCLDFHNLFRRTFGVEGRFGLGIEVAR